MDNGMRLTLLLFLALLISCKSHKTRSKSEVSEKTKSEQVTSQVDTSSTQTLRTYEKAIQHNWDRGTIVLFDSLSTVTIEPSGAIRASGYGARVSTRESGSSEGKVSRTDQVDSVAISIRAESKTAESGRTAILQEKEVRRAVPWLLWVLGVVCVLGGLAQLAFFVFNRFNNPFKKL
jgi:uncharacterized membrane protein YecN with MAPEG domain